MPQHSRHLTPGSLQHIISRFVDRQWRLSNAADRRVYLRIVDDIASDTDWIFSAFALMSSHTHWATIPGFSTLNYFYHRLHTRYAIYWRKAYDSVGPIFAGRPKNYKTDPDSLLRLVAYIHMNPVRAGIVSAPDESDWSSHVYYMRKKTAPKWLAVEKTLSLLGFDDTPSGRKQFDEAVRTICPHDKQTITKIARPLSNDALVQPGRSETNLSKLHVIATFVEQTLDVPAQVFRSRSKYPEIVAAKRLFIDLARTHGYRCPQIGTFLGISSESARYLGHRNTKHIEL